MDRTVRLNLRPTPDQARALADTASEFTGAFNLVCEVGWREREKNGVTLHHRTYREARVAFPGLVSDLHIQARVKATEAVRSALALAKKKGKVSQPRSAECPARYNLKTMIVDWKAKTVRLSTSAGRQSIAFDVPAFAQKYVGHPTATADLICLDGSWRLHVVVNVPAPEVQPSGQVVGVDLGLAHPAVLSTAQFLGERRWRNIEKKRFKLKRDLQRAQSKAANRHLKRIRRKQARFRRDCDHVLSRRIVQAAAPGTTIVVENLKDIRKTAKARHGRAARRLHGWSFAQLRSFIEYKSEEIGCTVAGVNPAHTSQRCSRCSYTARNNRRSRGLFKCRGCSFQLDADLNGSRNIADKYRATLGMSESGEAPVNGLIVGGNHASASLAYKPPT